MKRSRARSRRSIASHDNTPQGQRGGQTNSSGVGLEADLDRITSLVKNVSHALYSRSTSIATTTTASSRTSQRKGKTRELHDATNGSKSIPELNIDGPLTPMTTRGPDLLSRPITSSQSCMIHDSASLNKDPKGKMTYQGLTILLFPSVSLQIHPPVSSQEPSRSRRVHSPPPQLTQSNITPLSQPRPTNTRTLGMKGASSGKPLQEAVTKPFKVPFAVADTKKHAVKPVQPSSSTGPPPHPEPTSPPRPVRSSTRERSSVNLSSSSDSFEMDSFGDDRQAIEACLSQYD